MSKAWDDVISERERQKKIEGWSDSHDDEHADGALARAAACYAICDFPQYNTKYLWPWERKWWKPKDRRRNLVRAAALIVAEIERLDRAANDALVARRLGKGVV